MRRCDGWTCTGTGSSPTTGPVVATRPGKVDLCGPSTWVEGASCPTRISKGGDDGARTRRVARRPAGRGSGRGRPRRVRRLPALPPFRAARRREREQSDPLGGGSRVRGVLLAVLVQ